MYSSQFRVCEKQDRCTTYRVHRKYGFDLEHALFPEHKSDPCRDTVEENPIARASLLVSWPRVLNYDELGSRVIEVFLNFGGLVALRHEN